MKITLFPGGFQLVKNYGGYKGVDIWTGQEFLDELKDSDYFIGHSGGASFAMRYASNQTSKFIFVNPLIKKRSLPNLFLRWLKFLIFEGIEKKKIIPAKYWPYALKKFLKLKRINFLDAIKQMPKENLIVIRGKQDNFFCDEKSAKIIKDNNIRIIEVEAGHDWNENIAEAVNEIIFML